MRFLLFFIYVCKLFLFADTLDLGAGVGSMIFPDYIGSKSTQTLSIPYPFIRYKSDNFSIDENGINSKIFGIEDLKLELSLGGSLPASSKNNNKRKGMYDLDFTFEAGPSISYKIFSDGSSNFFFQVPTRAVFSTDLRKIDTQGVIATTEFMYEYFYKHFEFTYRLGAVFADAQYHEYFYSVASEYVTPERNYYDAKGGYNSLKNRLSVIYSYKNWWLGAYVSYYNIKGAVYENSPLVETSNAFFYGASLAYIFYTK